MRIYARSDLTSKVVVDVGAAIGDTALYFGKRGAAHVFAFEMDKVRCDLARKNIARNNMQDRITLIEEPATADKINSLQYDFIKIDCEGCEYQTILSSEEDTLKFFSHIQIEYHDGYKNLKEKLEKCDFTVTVTTPLLEQSATSLGKKMSFTGYLYATRKKI
jgi:tRNA G37 N-methylase Trm5